MLASWGVLPPLVRLHDEQQQIEAHRDEVREIERRRTATVERQEQRRKNIAALGASGDEGAVRLKMVKELQAAEDEITEAGKRISALNADSERRKKAILDRVAALAGR